MEQVGLSNPDDVWFDFMKWLKLHRRGTYYRGVEDKINHLLIPSVGRMPNYSFSKELDLFEHFKLRVSLTAARSYNDMEWLVLAQHHSLPTRLLDWTTNPLVAAFFAVRKKDENEARIYACYDSYKGLGVQSGLKSPFELGNVLFIIPPVSSKRIELQRGLFSVHPVPNIPCTMIHHVDGDSLIAEGLDKFNNYLHPKTIKPDRLLKSQFDVPAHCKQYFEDSIRSFGIDETIFGDVDSIANQLKSESLFGQLSKIVIPNNNYLIPLWQKIIPEKVRDFFEAWPKEWPIKNDRVVTLDLFSCLISKIQDLSSERRRITATINLIISPNVTNISGLFATKDAHRKVLYLKLVI